MSKKAVSKKVYLAIALVVIFVVSIAAVVYVTQQHSTPKPVVNVSSGLQVGDTFTYNITGVSYLYSSDANPDSEYPGFEGLNNTAYTVTITGVNGTIVSYSTNMILTNGTSSPSTGFVNISSGNPTGDAGFWAIYPTNLNLGDLVNPGNPDGPMVSNFGNQTYSDSSRGVDYFSISQNFTNINDPTGNTQQQRIDNVVFDQSTGMLTSLEDIQEFNNPEMTLDITWQLTATSVWTI
jgi:hypothetical protein